MTHFGLQKFATLTNIVKLTLIFFWPNVFKIKIK
jgi:hypothetical protein